MAEQELNTSSEMGEFPSGDSMTLVEAEDERADGELAESGEEEAGVINDSDKTRKGETKKSDKSSHCDKDSSTDSQRKRHNSSDHRKHHHHGHNNSNSDALSRKKRRSHSGEEGGDDHDRGKRSNKRSGSTTDSHSDRGNNSSVKQSHSHDRKHSNSKHSSRSHRNKDKDPHGETADASRAKKEQKKKQTDKADVDAEDGEILEEGELSDDDDDVEQKPVTDSSREDIRDSPVKSSRKDEKTDKSSRDHKDRRKDGDKRKPKKYVDVDDLEEGEEPSNNNNNAFPAWGSGFLGAKKGKPTSSQSPPYGKAPRGGRGGGKGYYMSPPGLYDSPSYSDDSESEPALVAKPFGGLMADGYVDASVAADEKEGVYKQTHQGTKRKKKNRSDRPPKRKATDYDKSDGPSPKKSTSDRPVCKFYRDGKCAKGAGCTFNHDIEPNKRMEVCKYHLTVKGCHKEKCLYMHEDYPCKYYHTGAQCFSGERCKFSHDPLTDDTRRALEMRVAAEDIIDIDGSDYDYDYEGRPQRGFGSRPSILGEFDHHFGSPPRRYDLKKIPSLFDIETRPPGNSPKPSPQPTRPTGFYNESIPSPNPEAGGGGGGNGPQLSPNPNNSNNPNNNIGSNNNNNPAINPGMGLPSNPSGPGLGLLGPGGPRPGLNGPVGGLLRTPGGVAMLAATRPPFSGNQSTPNNPVLNMLGAIIREATIQNVAPAMMSAMASSINQMSSTNNGGNTNNMPINNLGQCLTNMNGNLIVAKTMGMLRMAQASGGNQMGPGGPGMRMNRMNAPNNNGMMNAGNPITNTSVPPPPLPHHPSVSMEGGDSGGQGPPYQEMAQRPSGPGFGMEGGEDMMDVDYRIKGPSQSETGSNAVEQTSTTTEEEKDKEDSKMEAMETEAKETFDESEDEGRDLSELDRIRRRIQAQIEKAAEEEEDEENEEEEEGKLAVVTDKDGGLSPDRLTPKDDAEEDHEAAEPSKAEPESGTPSTEDLMSSIEVPTHLPKKQRELFMRIQQQHLLREKQKEQQEALLVEEQAEASKEEKDDWYSDSDDEASEITATQDSKQPPPRRRPSTQEDPVVSSSSPSLPTPLPISSSSLSQLVSMAASITSSLSSVSSGSVSTATPTSSTTATTSAPSTINIMQMINQIRQQTSTTTTTATTAAAGSSAPPQPKEEDHSTTTSASPASPPPEQPPLPLPPPPGPQPKPVGVDPPVVSAMPKNPLPYAVVKVSLDMPKIYTVLPSGVNPSDPTYRHDPRVKRHIQFLEKQLQALPPAPPPKEKELARKLSSEDKEKPGNVAPLSDPRFNKQRPAGDPRLQAKQGSSPRAEEPRGDPRLRKDTAGGQPPVKAMDPRLARRAAATAAAASGGGGGVGNMDPRLMRQMSQEAGSAMMGGGGPTTGPMGNMGAGNAMGVGSMNNPMNNASSSMGVPGGSRPFPGSGMMGMNSMGGGNMGLNNRMAGPLMGGLPQGNTMMGGLPGNNMMGGLQGNNMMGVSQGNNMMGGLQGNNMMGGLQGNMGIPQGNNMMGVSQNNNMMGVSQNNMMGGPRFNNTMGGLPSNNMIGGQQGSLLGGPQSNMSGPQGTMMGGLQGNMGGPQGTMMGGLQGNMGGPQGNMSGPQGNMGGPQGNMGGPQGNMGGPQGNMMGGLQNGPQMCIGGRGQMVNGPGGQMPSNERAGNEVKNDPRLISRTVSDPRGSDPRLRNKPMDPRDEGQAGASPTSVSRDPRSNPTPMGDPRNRSRRVDAQPGSSPNMQMDSHWSMDATNNSAQKPVLPPLPPLSSSASLPPLPSLSPPQSSFAPTPHNSSPQPSKESLADSAKPAAKKFDYRNDPRFKRVKRTAGQRKGSLEYSSPLGGEDSDPRARDESGSPQSPYNGYNRPKPPSVPGGAGAPLRRPKAPSPSLPDTLQDFDLPELSPSHGDQLERESDFKVKELFKTFDPTASPFC